MTMHGTMIDIMYIILQYYYYTLRLHGVISNIIIVRKDSV